MTPPVKDDLKETDWEDFTKLEIPSGKLLIMDPLHVDELEDGLLVPLPQGEYSLMIKEIPFAGISRLRVASPGGDPELGKHLGDVWTDIASIGVCDGEAFERLTKTVDVDELWNIRQPVFDVDRYETVILKKKLEVPLAVVACGDDGEYPVFELLSDSERIGVEIEFLEPGTSVFDF